MEILLPRVSDVLFRFVVSMMSFVCACGGIDLYLGKVCVIGWCMSQL